MPDINGFDMLEAIDKINFDVVFTTAYDEYALKAFKVSAMDYLLKPIDEEELMIAVDKLKHKQEHRISQESRIKNQESRIHKISLNTLCACISGILSRCS